MNMKHTMREDISAFADGELSASQANHLLSKNAQREIVEDWDLYQTIGDVLRSDDTPAVMSKDFAAKFAARFEQEPVVFAPAAAAVIAGKCRKKLETATLRRRWMLPGAAAAVAVIVASLSAPQFITPFADQKSAVVAVSPSVNVEVVTDEVQMLRDPRIDDYLLAHQQFAPSLYNSAHYVRSATFATESSK